MTARTCFVVQDVNINPLRVRVFIQAATSTQFPAILQEGVA